MIRHVVMWKVAGRSADERSEARRRVQAAFEGLRGRIPGMTRVEIGADVSGVDYACDLVLVADFESDEALRAYAEHPAHARVREELAGLRIARHRWTTSRGDGGIMEFIYQARPARVIFGAGSLRHLEDEVQALGAQRAGAVHAGAARRGRIGRRAAGRARRRRLRPGGDARAIEVARDAREFARSRGADCAVAVGGGSTVGLGKAIALESSLPILAIPTTYAGSEMTPIYGVTENGLKRTGTDPRVLPRTVLYDPQLSLSLPVDLSVASGINAMAHAAEGLYAADANPVMSLMAEEGIAALARGLPGLRRDAADPRARGDALYGAWLCGTVLGNVGMALHHKLCHTLGGSFNLPHAQTHAIILPHALAYNAAAAPEAMRRIARALGAEDAARGMHAFARAVGAPLSLADIGMRMADLDRAADLAVANPYRNPRPVERGALRALLQDAFDGAPPRKY